MNGCLFFEGCFLFIIFMCKQAEHQEGNPGCYKGETVKTAQTVLLYFFKSPLLLYALRGVMHLFPTTMGVVEVEGGGDQRAVMVNDSKQFSPLPCTYVSGWPTIHLCYP